MDMYNRRYFIFQYLINVFGHVRFFIPFFWNKDLGRG